MAGINAASGKPSPRRFHALGKAVTCTQCGGDRFEPYGALGVTFGGYALECSQCSHLEYFGKRPTQVEDGGE